MGGKDLKRELNVDSEVLLNLIKTSEKNKDGADLVILGEGDCSKIGFHHWRNITLKAGYCNLISSDMVISSHGFLRTIVIKGSPTSAANTLGNLNSLTIKNNPLLKSVVVEDGFGSHYSSGSTNYYGGCANVKSVSLTGLIDLILLI